MRIPLITILGILAPLAPAMSATFSPVSVTGFGFDAVVENNAAAGTSPNVYTSVATALDATNNNFYETGLPGSGASTGLPTSKVVTASTGGNDFTFQLANYGNNAGLVPNALQIAPGPGGHAFLSLNLVSPSYFTSMAFLGFSTESLSATAIGDVQLTFTDASTSIYSNSLDIPDWYVGTGSVSHPLIFNSTGRVKITNGLYNQDLSGVTASDGGKLFASLINLTALDQGKQVASIGFRITSTTSTDRTYIMSVAAVPEPTSLGLAAVTAGAVVFVLRRRTYKKLGQGRSTR